MEYSDQQELFSLTYFSDSLIPEEHVDAELTAIQQVASSNNRKLQVSGKLIYRQHHFIQRLEGPRANVDKVYEKIEGDNRHRNIKLLFYGEIGARICHSWNQMKVMTQDDSLSELDAFFRRVGTFGKATLSSQEVVYILNFIERHRATG